MEFQEHRSNKSIKKREEQYKSLGPLDFSARRGWGWWNLSESRGAALLRLPDLPGREF